MQIPLRTADSNIAGKVNFRSERLGAILLVCALQPMFAGAADDEQAERESQPVPGWDYAPDIRPDETRLKVQKGNFVAVPIPISNPTLGTGLVGGAAYFYGQTPEQKLVQPASVTGVAGMYTDNDSKALGVAHQNYWDEDRWRLGAIVAMADLRLQLLAPDGTSSGTAVDWVVEGLFSQLKFQREFGRDWYAGIGARYVDAEQAIDIEDLPDETATTDEIKTVGISLSADHDTRDMPLNSYSGHLFTVNALFNDEAIGSEQTYQSYSARYRSYHRVHEEVVVAWDVSACKRGGSTPLWDTCRLNLRGFSATDYLGQVSAQGQVEGRWQLSKRWGVVGFAGFGWVNDTFNDIRENEAIPSYGVGVRFMVLPAKRVNVRLDYGWSVDNSAIHLSVGEAF